MNTRKRWHLPARPLPVRLRPVGGETVVSYTFRLAAANALRSPTSVLRSLGEPTGIMNIPDMLEFQDVTLNPAALARLEAFTGIPVERLRLALPSLNMPLGGGQRMLQPAPLMHAFRTSTIRDHCQQCIARIPGQPRIRVHSRYTPRICFRHRRWVHTIHDDLHQLDLTRVAEVVNAERRYQRLLAATNDRRWTEEQLWQAGLIANSWNHTRHPHRKHFLFHRLHARWDERATFLPPQQPWSSVIVFPEAVTIAEALCDLDWRCHIAMSPSQPIEFYCDLARLLGQPKIFGWRLAYERAAYPLHGWVQQHRRRFRPERDAWNRKDRSGYLSTQLPSIRHFK